jgi:hypothetical protein
MLGANGFARFRSLGTMPPPFIQASGRLHLVLSCPVRRDKHLPGEGDCRDTKEETTPLLIDRPWVRVRQPRQLPDPLTLETMAELDDLAFAEIIRDHLVPRGTDKGSRASWALLWELLQTNDALAERGFVVLEEFLDAAKAKLEAGGEAAPIAGLLLATDALDEAEVKRVRKLHRLSEEAWQRIETERDQRP